MLSTKCAMTVYVRVVLTGGMGQTCDFRFLHDLFGPRLQRAKRKRATLTKTLKKI